MYFKHTHPWDEMVRAILSDGWWSVERSPLLIAIFLNETHFNANGIRDRSVVKGIQHYVVFLLQSHGANSNCLVQKIRCDLKLHFWDARPI